MWKAFQIHIHVVVPRGISDDSPDATQVTVVSRDYVYLSGVSSVFAERHYVWSYLSSVYYRPHFIIQLDSIRWCYDSAFVRMIGKDFDKLPFPVKEQRMWLPVRIRIAVVIYFQQQ